MIGFVKNQPFLFIISLSSVFFYMSFAYDLQRTDFPKFIMLYGALFFFFYKIVQISKNNFAFLTVLVVLFRLIFLFVAPNLSQDYFRFIWDGRMMAEGLNPYVSLPQDFIRSGVFPVAQAEGLYRGMGELNGSHYTVYPPLNQFIFLISVLLSKSIFGAVAWMRFVIILADLGTLYFGKKILERLQLPAYHIFWFLLNPFIIIEMTGNLHFEGVMIFLLLWGFYLVLSGKWKTAAVLLGFSASVKLISLIFIPMFFNYLGWKKFLVFGSLAGISFGVLYVPFLSDELLKFYFTSLNMYFNNFEFNASVFYIIRWVGYQSKGYNIIRAFGMVAPFVVLGIVLAIAFFRKNKTFQQTLISMLFAISVYYFMATVVHPWYVAVLLILSIFTRFRYPLLWSLVVMLSYFAYSNPDFKENFWLLAIEYVLVFGWLGNELFFFKKAQISN